METTSRFFLCARCRSQVCICSFCDRGQIYCAGTCAKQSRAASVRAAGARYQASRKGRFNHAARSRRYRARQNKVTHQGSPTQSPDALLPTNSTAAIVPAVKPKLDVSAAVHCHFCGQPQPAFVRRGFLRCRVRRIAIPLNVHCDIRHP